MNSQLKRILRNLIFAGGVFCLASHAFDSVNINWPPRSEDQGNANQGITSVL